MKAQYALITGASQGLGKAFAYELAQRGINCILIGLPYQNLDQLSFELSNLYHIDCRYYETDLTEKRNIIELTKWVDEHFNVFILINNAGIGGTSRFEDADLNYIDNIIQLNMTAPVLITHCLMKNLGKQEQSYVLNVSSMAAFSPMGYKTVYPASKTFIHYFTRGLYQEKADSNIFFSVVNPGPMRTNEDVSNRIDKQGFFAKLGLQSPEDVAHISIRQLFKKDTMVMLNFMNGFNWMLMRIIPIWIRLPLMTRMVRRELELNT
jgi:short-subunit dehydrogenase